MPALPAAPVLPPIRDRVAAGAVRLSQRSAGIARWFEYVDPASIDLNSCTRCVLGQVYGSFDRGLQQLDLTVDDTVTLGFDAAYNEAADVTAALEAAWRDEIAKAVAA